MRRASIGRTIAVCFITTVVSFLIIDSAIACRFLMRHRACEPVACSAVVTCVQTPACPPAPCPPVVCPPVSCAPAPPVSCCGDVVGTPVYGGEVISHGGTIVGTPIEIVGEAVPATDAGAVPTEVLSADEPPMPEPEEADPTEAGGVQAADAEVEDDMSDDLEVVDDAGASEAVVSDDLDDLGGDLDDQLPGDDLPADDFVDDAVTDDALGDDLGADALGADDGLGDELSTDDGLDDLGGDDLGGDDLGLDDGLGDDAGLDDLGGDDLGGDDLGGDDLGDDLGGDDLDAGFDDLPADEGFSEPGGDDLPGFDDADALPGDDLPADEAPATDDSLDDLFGQTSDELDPEPRTATLDSDVPADTITDETDDLFDSLPEPAAEEAAPADNVDDLDDLFGFRDVDGRTQSTEPSTRVVSTPVEQLSMRSWTDNTGRYQTIGRLVKISTTHVRLLKENGRFSTVSKLRLSPADAEYVQAMSKLLGVVDELDRVVAR